MNPNDDPPLVTVIVPVFNDARRLRACLAAIASQEGLTVPAFEVIVADNGSTDGIDGVLGAFPQVRVVREPTPGSYRARNLAAGEARGAWLAFTDADCVPALDWLSMAAEAFLRDPGPDLLVGEISLFDEEGGGTRHAAVAAYERATAFRQRYYAEVLGFGPTANLMVRASVFHALRGFDAERRSGGDKDFGQRATRAGHRLDYEPAVRVAHPIRADLRELEGKVRRVVGGEQVAAKGRPARALLDWLRYLALRPLRACLLIARHPALSARERWAAASLVPRVAWWQLHERARLLLGGEPRR